LAFRKEKFKSLLSTYNPANILIVSNSSGTLSKDPQGTAADALERNTGVKVLRHRLEKPGCGGEIWAYFVQQGRVIKPTQAQMQTQEEKGNPQAQTQNRDGGDITQDDKATASTTHKLIPPHDQPAKLITHPSQIVIIGDRLFTDVVMANMMGARAIWIKEGVVRDTGFVTRLEYAVEGWLRRRGWGARDV